MPEFGLVLVFLSNRKQNLIFSIAVVQNNIENQFSTFQVLVFQTLSLDHW